MGRRRGDGEPKGDSRFTVIDSDEGYARRIDALAKSVRMNRSDYVKLAIAEYEKGLARPSGEANAAFTNAGLLNIITDFTTHDFSDDLFNSNLVTILTADLNAFTSVHRHLDELVSRFISEKTTRIYVFQENDNEISQSNAFAINRFCDALVGAGAGHWADDGEARLKRFSICVVPAYHTPLFAFTTENFEAVSLPIVFDRTSHPEKRALVFKPTGKHHPNYNLQFAMLGAAVLPMANRSILPPLLAEMIRNSSNPESPFKPR